MVAKTAQLTASVAAAFDQSLQSSALQHASPLWMRAPQRDENGKAYSDFMLLIPGLKQQTDAGKQACLINIQQSLKPFADIVVYVDVNIRLSLLWVSHKSVPGITVTLLQAIQQALPEARVIAADFNTQASNEVARQGWLSAFGSRLKHGIKRLGQP